MTQRTGKAGYSLVEVSLALLVIGVGLLAVFGLFPDALGSARKSVEASEISEFADNVFASIEGVIAEPNFDWADLKPGYTLPTTDVLVSTQKVITVSSVSSPIKEVYEWIPNTYGWTGVDRFTLATFTYILTVEPNKDGTSLAAFKLIVWPGNVKDADPPVPISAGETFYREYAPLH